MAPTVVYESDQGSMIDYPDNDYLEIRYYEASSDFTGDTFNRWGDVMAGVVEQSGRRHILIDAVQFGMNVEEMDVDWRDANTMPRLNEAGVKKLALIMPAGFPAIGAPPAPEGPADFPTAFFATRAEARTWLAS